MAGSPLQQPSWFTGAPASKILTAALVLTHLGGMSSWASNSNEDAWAQHQQDGARWYYLSLITSKLTFGSSGEMAFGMIALSMQLKRLERQLGTRKLLALLLLSDAVAIGVEFLIMLMFGTDDIVRSYSGPYPWIGTLLYLYAKLEPRVHPKFVSILGFSFSEKSVFYALCVYLIGASGTKTIVPTMCGLLAGFLFLMTPSTIDLPDWLAGGSIPWSRYFAFFLDSPAQIHAPLLQLPQRRQARQPRAAAAAAAPPLQQQAPPQQMMPPPPPPPQEASVEQLTAMGFDRDSVLEALRRCDNNVEHAANRLLMGS